MTDLLRTLRADNPGPFTLDGTRVHIVGRDRPVVIDPGPPDAAHVEALDRALEGAASVTVLLTHGHDDHTGAVDPLVGRLRERDVPVEVLGSGHRSARPLADGE